MHVKGNSSNELYIVIILRPLHIIFMCYILGTTIASKAVPSLFNDIIIPYNIIYVRICITYTVPNRYVWEIKCET